MKKEQTIVEAAAQALRSLGKPSSINEIYSYIIDNHLYFFDTPTPEHVLRTTIRRHTGNIQRIDSSDSVMFDMTDDEIYGVTSMAINTSKRPATGIKRIHRSVDKEDLIKSLTSEQVGVFKEIWKLLLFAAQVGVSTKRREPINKFDFGKGIDQSTFGNCPSWPGIIYLLSLVETEKSDSLTGTPDAEDIRIAIFQEYANGGLSVMRDFFKDRPLDFDGVLAFIESNLTKPAASPDLEFTI
jgi:dnd system-associated protein 4